MKNTHSWRPTKYRLHRGILRSSNRPEHVSPGSRLVVDCIAAFYDRAIPTYARGRLVDLGCGNAPLFLKYRHHAASVTCVDWGKTLHNNDYLDVECDLNNPLPFNDSAFDTIILSDVLEHLPQPELLWREMHRILAPGGHLLMNVPYFYPLHEVPFDYYRYSRFALTRFAQRTDFQILELAPIGGSPEILTDIISKHLQFVPLVGPPFVRLLQALTLCFVHTRVGRIISQRSSERFPLGYALVARRSIAPPPSSPWITTHEIDYPNSLSE